MADFLGYTIHTHDIPIEVFLAFIQDDIKNIIRTHGHKNCGLSYEDVCDKIQTIITTKRTLLLKLMNEHGQNRLNSEWRSKKNGFLNKLFKEEGFINMCFPKKNYPNNPSINQLLSRHIKFCKEKDVKREAVEKSFNFNACREYDSWIETQRKSFHQEYLKNVRDFGASTVNKYFSTKEHTQGHDPVKTYLKSKLDCNQYNPSLKSHTKKQLEKEPTKELQPPMESNIISGSQGKDGSSPTDKDSESTETKPEENKSQRPKSHTPNSQILAPSKTEGDGTHAGQATHVISKAPGSPVNRDGEKNESIPTKGKPPTDRLQNARDEALPQAKSPPLPPEVTIPTPAIQSVPAATPTTGKNRTSSKTPVTSSSLIINSDLSLNSDSPSPSVPLPPSADTKGQDSAPQSNTTSDTFATTQPTESRPSTKPADSLLSQPQVPVVSASPVVTAPEVLGAPASSSTSTISTTVTTTTATTSTVTVSTISTMQNLISSPNQAPGTLGISQPPTKATPSGTKLISSDTDPQQTSLSPPTPTVDRDPGTISAVSVLPNSKGSIQTTDNQLPKDTQKAPANPSRTHVTNTDSNVQRTPHQIGQQNNTNAVQHPSNIDAVLSPSYKKRDTGKTVKLNTKTTSMDDSTVRINKNDNNSIIPEGITPLKHIIPTLLVILATVTLLFQLYKYTPFGFLLGRRKKRKKRDLRSTFVIPEESTYESPNIDLHEWEDHNLVGKTVENDVYTKLLKINRYKQEMQKRKKKNKKTLIEVHIEVLEEHKNDEWELHKGDFLEICLRGFINEENETYQNFPNSKLTINNTNEKTIEDIQKKEILWNNWIENYRNILEQWKKEDWFQNLKNEWKNEEQMYKEKNDKLQKNISNEQDTHSIVSQKEIWKQWISKQATLIGMFNKEDWFKSIIYAQDKEKDNCRINEYNNISVTSKTELKNEKTNEEGRSKNIIQKLMVQIHMMVLEECIKEDIIKHKELCIDNFIEEMHNNNNNDEKRNIPQCDTDDFNVLEYEEIHTSRNK
ncbi:STP1 protein [Plasmodium ovale wallikeri]|uniref:STP1 protein n=1 Tax=Plasmodium ovale wallikeri TaxID=864142 RepID=A0A1A9ANY5_PLAOA|nr:STP1 protein [Plasmodium ovale wallikeri]